MNQLYAFLGIVKCLGMILCLWENGTELKFEFAFLFQLLHSSRDAIFIAWSVELVWSSYRCRQNRETFF